MCELTITETQKQAIEHIVNVKKNRDEAANMIRELRAEMFANGKGHRAWFIGMKVRKMLNPPSKLTMAYIDSEIAYSIDVIENAECPDFVGDDGYSYCGLSDAWYEGLENQKEWLEVAKEIKKLL